MERGRTGRYEITRVSDEEVRAFVPDPLPPHSPVEWGAHQRLLERATLSLGRLDSLTTLLPDPQLFLYASNSTGTSTIACSTGSARSATGKRGCLSSSMASRARRQSRWAPRSDWSRLAILSEGTEPL